MTLELLKIISSDKQFNDLIDFRILTLRTGASFHIYLLLKKPVDHAFYDSYLSYGKGKENSFISRRAEQASQATQLKVLAGHERKK